jgi:hypothetical protein
VVFRYSLKRRREREKKKDDKNMDSKMCGKIYFCGSYLKLERPTYTYNKIVLIFIRCLMKSNPTL